MRQVLVLLVSLLLVSCNNVGVEHYAQERPTLDLVAFFSRPVQAWGCSRIARARWSSDSMSKSKAASRDSS